MMKNELKHNKRGYYSCKRLRLLQFLMAKGFVPRDEVPDPTNIKYKWWIFEQSAELETAIEEYFARFKKDA